MKTDVIVDLHDLYTVRIYRAGITATLSVETQLITGLYLKKCFSNCGTVAIGLVNQVRLPNANSNKNN